MMHATSYLDLYEKAMHSVVLVAIGKVPNPGRPYLWEVLV